jgi:H+/Cl- antiporter ClcA
MPPAPSTDAPVPVPAQAPSSTSPLKLLGLAALLGLPVSIVAILFTSAVAELTTLLWTTIPDGAGWSEPPAWYVLLLPTLSGLLVFGAVKLPGNGGHSPLQGLGLTPLTPRDMPGVVLAAIASLSFGIVLGPEAPLTAIGLCSGLVFARWAGLDETGVKILSLAGAFAAIATIFAGPIPSSMLLMEAVAASGAVASVLIGRLLVPGLLAAGIGALLFTGVGDWSGVHSGGISAIDLPAYTSVRVVDILWAIPISLVVAILVVLAQRGGHLVADRVARRRPLPSLLVAGLLIGALAVVFRLITDKPIEFVLFSGADSLNAYAAEAAGGVLLVAAIAKALAYSISLGAGFRGGPVFPSIGIGVAIGAMCGDVLPGAALTPAIVAGLAAGPAAAMRLPFFGALLATLLSGASGRNAIPIAVIAAVIGWAVPMALDRRASAVEDAAPAAAR